MARPSSELLKRRLEIAKIVRKQGEVKVDNLSERLQVSNVTIRQDLTYLEQQGYLKRSFGGAIYITPEGTTNHINMIDQHYSQNMINNHEIDIVRNCLDYINDGDTLFLSHGPCIRKLIPFLYDKKSLTLIVNDLKTAQLAKEFTDAEVILVSGILLNDDVLQDNQQIQFMLKQYPVSIFIIELATINTDNQLIIEHMDQINTYQCVLKKANFTIAILPQRIDYNENHNVGKLIDLDIVMLSKSAVTEYHHQLLNADFSQLNTNKYYMTYQNTRGK